MTIDYNAKLAQDTATIRDKVRRGMLPLVARNPALDKITREYAEAQADHYAGLRNPPIALRNSALLDRCADLILHEDLTWSHPDKMSIVEYPIMSDWQAESRAEKFLPNADLKYGDMRFKGRRKISTENRNGVPGVSRRRVFYANEDGLDVVDTAVDVQDALDNAGLTDRQLDSIILLYFEKMTQVEAATELGVTQQAVAKFEQAALRKLREYMTQ